MKLSAYAYTNKGGREHNEDSLRWEIRGSRGIFILADGLGGHASGEVASGLAADAIFEGCRALDGLDGDALVGLLHEANGQVIVAQNLPNQAEMKTTAVCLYTEDDKAAWTHIGDSRLYHFRSGEIIGRTKDHSVTYRKYLGGEISYMDVYHDDDRSSLLRVLGKEPCNPEQGGAELRLGDAFLLCSDGFWEYVYDEEMLVDLLKSPTPEAWAQHMLLRHVRRVAGENDNLSLIVAFVEEA